MKTRPDSVKVMGHVVPIEYKDVGTKNLGYYEDRKITLNINKNAHWNKRVLFHETIHAIFHFSGVSNFLSDKLEEAIVECLENNLYPIIKFIV